MEVLASTLSFLPLVLSMQQERTAGDRLGLPSMEVHSWRSWRSCSAITLNCSAALLAGAQESLLGLHTFLGDGGIPTNRVRVSLSIRRTQEARSNAGPRIELTAEALIAFYAALTGGAEALMGLSIRLMHHDASGPPGSPQGLLADLRRVPEQPLTT